MSAQSSTEPNLANAIRLIEKSDFEKSKISHWCCSIRAVAAALGLPPESLPARWQAIAHRVKQLHHARVGMAEKTLKNHIANLKAALRHLSGDKTIPARGMRDSGALSEADLARLDDLRAALEEHREIGLTPKNLTVVRAILSGNVWREMVDLPERLMAEAKKTVTHAPHRAALSAQIAIGIAIIDLCAGPNQQPCWHSNWPAFDPACRP